MLSLEEFYRRFDPEQPAGQFYVDCTDVRGNEQIGKEIFMDFAGSPAASYRHKIFTGHIGGGKSTELHKICDLLRQEKYGKSYLPVYVDMDEYMDVRDVDLHDVLLAIVSEIGESFRNELDVELKDSYLFKRFIELKDTLLSDVKVSKTDLDFGKVKFGFTLNRRSPEFRQQVRDKLFRTAESFTDEVNNLLEEARVKLVTHSDYKDFVLVVDGLDKIERLRGGKDTDSDIAGFFLDNANQLKSIRAHSIWTAPLKVVRTHGPEMGQRYDGQPTVLPMIRVRLRNGQPCEPGIVAAKKIILTRLDGHAPDEFIDADALNEIVKYSGGHMRMLVQLVRHAGGYAELDFPIKAEHATKAINSVAKTFAGTLRDGDWDQLVGLENSTTKEWDISQDGNTRLLEQLCVLEYVNGDGDGIGQSIQWYAVHPIVQELPRFKEAKAKASAIQT